MAAILSFNVQDAKAYWDVDESVRLTTAGDPDVWYSGYADASASHNESTFNPVVPTMPAQAVITTNTSANAPAKYYPPYNIGIASSHIKIKLKFIAIGPDTPLNLKYEQEWDVTPGNYANMVGIYSTASFDGVQVTVPSNSIPLTTRFTLSSNNTELIYSTGSTSSSGYSHGGYVERKTNTFYRWDFQPLIDRKIFELT
jgi:hypothetical protein